MMKFTISEKLWKRITDGRYVLIPEGNDPECYDFIRDKGRCSAIDLGAFMFKEPDAFKETFARAVQTYGFKSACDRFHNMNARKFSDWLPDIKCKRFMDEHLEVSLGEGV